MQEEVVQELQPRDRNDLIQLAMNCCSHAAATAGSLLVPDSLDLLPHNAQPDSEHLGGAAVRKLLLTAVKRQHLKALMQMLIMKADSMVQFVDPPTLEVMLRYMVNENEPEYAELLPKLPAAGQLSSAAVMELLQTACLCSAQPTSSTCMVQFLCNTQAAKALSSTDAVQLLHAVFPDGQTTGSVLDAAACVEHFCSLPASQQLSSSKVRQALLLLVMLDHGCGSGIDSFDLLSWLPSAQLLTSAEVTMLLEAAVKRGASGNAAVVYVCKLPAAKQLLPSVVYDLLKEAIQSGAYYSTAKLCTLPAAYELSPQSVMDLLRIAIETDDAYVEVLCRLPVAYKFCSTDFKTSWQELPAHAVLHGSEDCIEYLSTQLRVRLKLEATC
jgi:hypothetical protein